ncbi:MAG TPA: twin-arginine translocase TatA/TatE family subunit [Ilumatobacteraceae bacterium]|nr:twin-arginine translocase TatA/TatE family subunit [Ilumatobacteraceae bacterium]
MFAFDLGGPELIIILVLVLVLFGGSQLPKLAKNLGQAQKEFKDGLSAGEREAAENAAKRAQAEALAKNADEAKLAAAKAEVARLEAEANRSTPIDDV